LTGSVLVAAFLAVLAGAPIAQAKGGGHGGHGSGGHGGTASGAVRPVAGAPRPVAAASPQRSGTGCGARDERGNCLAPRTRTPDFSGP
jgi:hypothetical protein